MSLTVNSVAFSAQVQSDGSLSFEVAFYINDKLFTVRESYSPRPLPWHTVFYGREQYNLPTNVRVRFPWAPDWEGVRATNITVTTC